MYNFIWPTRTINCFHSCVPFLHVDRRRSIVWINISGGKGLIPTLHYSWWLKETSVCFLSQYMLLPLSLWLFDSHFWGILELLWSGSGSKLGGEAALIVCIPWTPGDLFLFCLGISFLPVAKIPYPSQKVALPFLLSYLCSSCACNIAALAQLSPSLKSWWFQGAAYVWKKIQLKLLISQVDQIVSVN